MMPNGLRFDPVWSVRLRSSPIRASRAKSGGSTGLMQLSGKGKGCLYTDGAPHPALRTVRLWWTDEYATSGALKSKLSNRYILVWGTHFSPHRVYYRRYVKRDVSFTSYREALKATPSALFLINSRYPDEQESYDLFTPLTAGRPGHGRYGPWCFCPGRDDRHHPW